MVSLIDTTYDTTEQVVPDNGPKFADEAEALLAADPKKVRFAPFSFSCFLPFLSPFLTLPSTPPLQFAERYGDYFVAGYSCRAHLTAMATHRSQDKEEMDKFALSVQAGLDEAGVVRLTLLALVEILNSPCTPCAEGERARRRREEA